MKIDVGAASKRRSIQGWPGLNRRGREVLKSRLIGSMSIYTVAMAVRLALRIVVFGIVATAMGAEQFGALATVSAIAAIFAAFSGWGADQLLFRRVARARADLPRAMATSLAFLAVSAPPIILLATVLIPFAVSGSISRLLILSISVSDVGFAEVNGIAADCYQAIGRPMGNFMLTAGFGILRVLAALLWIVCAPRHDALSWSYYYAGASAVAALASLWLLNHDLGKPEWTVAWHEWRDGFYFALQTASQTASASVDKPVIAALADLQVAGLYAAASRIVAAAGIPVSALLYSAYVRFFEVGVSGPRSSARLAIRLLPIGIAMGAVGGIAILLLAPFAPRVLGRSYLGTDSALLILAALPSLSVVQSLGLDVVVSVGRTGLRTLAQLAMPPINILLCCLLVPSHGVAGAAWAALLTRLVLAVAAWAIVALLVRGGKSLSTVPVKVETGIGARPAE